MQLLASVLPGLRQLRAPLASGYLWLLAAGLALAELIPKPAAAQAGILRDVYDAAAAAGHSAITVAATFTAYLVGVLSVQATTVLLPTLRVLPKLRVLRKQAPIGSRTRPETTVPSAAGQRMLREAVLDQLAARYDKDPELEAKLAETRARCGAQGELSDSAIRRAMLDVRFDIDAYARNLERDLPLMPLRLLGEEKEREIYGEFDRRRAEAEFRAAVALPLAALVVVIAVRTSAWWLLALAGPALLVLEARRQATAAADILAESIRARAPHSPALDHVRAGPLQERTGWVTRAADLGYPGAMVYLAQAFENGADLDSAEKWYREAAKKGNPTAAIWLAGRLHLRGDQEAEKWYGQAAEAGEPIAITIQELSRKFTPDQMSDAKAAHAGDPAAMMLLAQHYEEHELLDDAYRWYNRAHEAGHSPASLGLADLLRKQNKPVAAEQWLRSQDGGPGNNSTEECPDRPAHRG